MMMKHRVENELYLVRDSDGSIINTDRSGYTAVLANKAKRLAALESMRMEITELRCILNTLIEERAMSNGTNNSQSV